MKALNSQLLQDMASSASPATPRGAVSARRRQQRRANYLAGEARSAYRLSHSLQAGLLEASTSSSSTSSSSSISCKRGCSHALEELRDSFMCAGQHPLKDQQKRVSSYPVTKKYTLCLECRSRYRKISS